MEEKRLIGAKPAENLSKNGKAVNVSMTLQSMLLDKKQKDVAIGVMLKATRNREYLCDEWSDDSKLWVKGEVIMS